VRLSRLIRKAPSELRLARAAAAELKATHKLSQGTSATLLKVFGKRLEKARDVVKSKGVRLHEFAPGGRMVWTVHGKSREYQVMPEIPFCYCDDYYYRVMSQSKGLCYHLIAQMLAEASNHFEHLTRRDSEYLQTTDKWRSHTKKP